MYTKTTKKVINGNFKICFNNSLIVNGIRTIFRLASNTFFADLKFIIFTFNFFVVLKIATHIHDPYPKMGSHGAVS